MHTSDCDVLAVRLPFTFEAVGGDDEDWDEDLTNELDFRCPVGIICEVKSGRYKATDLFPRETLEYSIARLGFVPRDHVAATAAELVERPVTQLADGTQIAKLFIARHRCEGPFLMHSLTDVEQFLRRRVEMYPKEKYADRMFFGPVLFQTIIEQTAGHLGE